MFRRWSSGKDPQRAEIDALWTIVRGLQERVRRQQRVINDIALDWDKLMGRVNRQAVREHRLRAREEIEHGERER